MVRALYRDKLHTLQNYKAQVPIRLQRIISGRLDISLL